jgi:hypothetical protein
MATQTMSTTPRDRRSRSSGRGFPRCSARSRPTSLNSNVQNSGWRMAPTASANSAEPRSRPSAWRRVLLPVPACSADLSGIRRPARCDQRVAAASLRVRTPRERPAKTATGPTVSGRSSRTRRTSQLRCRSVSQTLSATSGLRVSDRMLQGQTVKARPRSSHDDEARPRDVPSQCRAAPVPGGTASTLVSRLTPLVPAPNHGVSPGTCRPPFE